MKQITPSLVRQTTRRAITSTLKVFGAVFGALLIVLVSGPAAYAASGLGPADFVGCANFDFLAGVASISKQVTGWGIGVVVVIACIMLIVGAGALALAGKRIDKAQDAQAAILNVVRGLGVLLVGIPVLITIAGVVSTAFCAVATG
jgi:hypothetical protein